MIKTKLFVIFILFIVITACARHYVKQSESSLSFYYNGEKADKVLFYSDINDFTGKKFKKSEGYWVYSINKPADLKEIKFFYKINGKVHIPECEMKISDDFGGKLCVLEF